MLQKNNQNNNCSVRVAYEPNEIKNWTERIIVVDLFRFSNTVCALLASGRENIRIYSEPTLAIAAKKINKNTDLFSEIEFPFINDRYDNSPFLALTLKEPKRATVIVTRSGSKTVMAAPRAKEIIIGCFANMPQLCEYNFKNKMDTLIAPACLFYDRNHVEDFICARSLEDAFNGKDTFDEALEEIHESSRILDFIAMRPENGRKDIEMILKKGTMKILPKAIIRGVFAEVFNLCDEDR
ncbi:MAG: 2-phosphosulfolactate phosphatase [Elusimicrobia bacterium]|nr:2-phosphosulfolactate phosphatase [Elusimicrobiota bacterium]